MTRASVPRRENAAARKERAERVADRLAETYPEADCELDYRNAWELLIATILSAQCTDKMVNQVTPALFERFPDPVSLAKGSQKTIEKLIRRTGFFSQKTKSIRAAATAVVENFGGEVPHTIDELTTLQGVGRKTASVVVGTAFGQPAVFVDTHVKRLMFRLGLTKSDDPDKIEGDVKGLLPSERWTAFCHRLIHHGRRICFARSPRCPECPLLEVCPQLGVATVAPAK